MREKHDRRKGLPRAQVPVLALSLGLTGASAVWLTALQYRSVEEIGRDQEQHRGLVLQAAFQRATQAFDREITRAHMAFQMSSMDARAAGETVETWTRLAPYPRIVQRVYSIQATGAGGLRVIPLPESLSKSPIEISALVPLLEQRLSLIPEQHSAPDDGMTENPLGFQLTTPRPLLTFPPHAGFGFSAQRPPTNWLFVELDESYLLHSLLPGLLKSELGDWNDGGYEFAVFRRSDGKRLTSSEPSTLQTQATLRAMLLQIRPGCLGVTALRRNEDGLGLPGPGSMPDTVAQVRSVLTDAGGACSSPNLPGPSRAGLWELKAAPRSDGFSPVRVLQQRNLMVTSAAALSLAASLAAFLLLVRRAQELARLQIEFVASVSHELRTPIGTIGIAAGNLTLGLVRDEQEAIRYGRILSEEGRRLSHLIEQVLSYARALSPNWEPCTTQPLAIAEVVDSALRTSERSLRAAGLAVECSVPFDLPAIRGDLHSLARCLHNLLDNARKYALEGGTVSIRAEAIQGRRGAEVILRVEDRGPGIEQDERKRIFEPFFRGRQASAVAIPGFGLGLSIVKRIMEAHGGTLETYRPQAGEGAGFAMRFPAFSPGVRVGIHME